MKQTFRSRMRTVLPALLVFTLAVALDLDWSVEAHEGEQHGTPAPGPGSATGGPVKLTPEARKNLGLETAPVTERSLALGPTGFGRVEARPGAVYVVSARISGRATAVHKVPGDPVRAGEPVIEVESRVVADPPVRVSLFSRIAGTVIERSIEVGQPVEPDQSLLMVADLSRVLFRIEVFEVDFGHLAVGQKVDIRFESWPDRPFTGTIRRLGSVADPETRTLPAWAEIENDERLLRVNMRGSARILTRETGLVIVVPREAVLGDASSRFVFLDTGPEFVPTPVAVGAEDGGWIEIRSGLIPGDQVVVKGNYELQYVAPAGDPDDEASSVARNAPAGAGTEPARKRGRFGC